MNDKIKMDKSKIEQAKEGIKWFLEHNNPLPYHEEGLQTALSIMQDYEEMTEKYSQEIMKNTMLMEERDTLKTSIAMVVKKRDEFQRSDAHREMENFSLIEKLKKLSLTAGDIDAILQAKDKEMAKLKEELINLKDGVATIMQERDNLKQVISELPSKEEIENLAFENWHGKTLGECAKNVATAIHSRIRKE